MNRLVSSIALLFALVFVSVIGYQISAADALCFAPYGAADLKAIAEDENLYVMWQYGTSETGDSGDHFLQFKRSTDAGRTFDETINIYHSAPKCSLFPRMSADGNNVYIMWQDGGILFRASNDGGTTFGETLTLGSGSLGSIGTPFSHAEGGQILSSGNRVFTVWEDDGNIVFRKSDDAGKSFGTAINLSQTNQSYRPEIALSGSNVYVAWTDNYYCAYELEQSCESKAMFVRSNDYGETFSKPVDLEEITGDTLAMPVVLQMIADNRNLHILWREGGLVVGNNTNYYHSRSDDDGKTFSSKVALLDPEENERSHITSFSAFDGTVYALKRYQDDAGVLKSVDGGKFAEPDLPIPAEFLEGGQFSMIDGQAYFLWTAYSEEERRISFASSHEGSHLPVSTIDLFQSDYVAETAPPSNVVMAISGDIVHVMWIDSTGTSSDYQQNIIVRSSTDAGKSFGESVLLVSMTTVPEFGSFAAMLMAVGIIGVIVSTRLLR